MLLKSVQPYAHSHLLLFIYFNNYAHNLLIDCDFDGIFACVQPSTIVSMDFSLNHARLSCLTDIFRLVARHSLEQMYLLFHTRFNVYFHRPVYFYPSYLEKKKTKNPCHPCAHIRTYTHVYDHIRVLSYVHLEKHPIHIHIITSQYNLSIENDDVFRFDMSFISFFHIIIIRLVKHTYNAWSDIDVKCFANCIISLTIQ